jgi:membrane protease YdiL (CAAX protease family)
VPAEPLLPEVLPPDGVSYPLILRGPTYALWRSLLGVVFGLSLFLLLSTVIGQLVVLVGWTLTAADRPYADYVRSALAFERPSGLLAANLGILSLVPISIAMLAVLHHVRPRWLMSVQPGIRWRYLLVCLVVALVSLNGVLLLSQLASGRPAFDVQPGYWGFVAVILLTSPLQAAAEEIFFRGYLMQALGSVVARPWFGVVTSALVFALMHGTQNVALFVNRLAFGLLAGVLVWWVGGLEAGIAAHVANNVVAFVWAGLTTSIATLRAKRSLTWVESGVQILGFVLCAVAALLVARLLRLRTRVDLTAPGVTS